MATLGPQASRMLDQVFYAVRIPEGGEALILQCKRCHREVKEPVTAGLENHFLRYWGKENNGCIALCLHCDAEFIARWKARTGRKRLPAKFRPGQRARRGPERPRRRKEK